jgi:hypothetical protein
MKRENDYSQFHFGAGEASVIEMVTKLEEAEEGALVLIEEIENGLHPLATEKMVEYLFDVAKRKKSQIIFTTHSENAIKNLPPQAIWACIDGIAYNGKLSIESLRALTGSVAKSKVIFVEDEFAKDFCEEMLRQLGNGLMAEIEVHKAGGYPYVVDVMIHHNKNPAVMTKAVAVIDGDNPSDRDNNVDVIRLPDEAPEQLVFGWIYSNVDNIAALIQQRCQCPSVSQDNIATQVRSTQINTGDHHLYFKNLGDSLGFLSEIVVRRGLCSIYVEKNREMLSPIVNKIVERLTQNS